MDGKPMWVERNEEPYDGKWFIVDHADVENPDKTLYTKEGVTYSDYGKYFTAYAYPPAHIDREEWVSVEERLPDDNERVIAYRPNEADVSAYKYCVMWGWSVKMSMKHRGISHWMPLPEPPADLEKRMGVME